MSTEQNIKIFLSEEFGLSQNEIDLYICLLKQGPSTVMESATYTSMNRATVHMNVEYLTKKGLVTQTKRGRGSRRLIVAEAPERLSLILDQKKTKVLRAENDLPLIIKDIHHLIPTVKENTDVDVKYYVGKNEVQFIYEDVLKANELRTYVNAKEVAKVFVNNMDNFIKAHNEHANMQIWEIMNSSEDVENYAKSMANNRYHYKFIPDSMNLSVIDYMIYDGKVAIITIKEDAKGLVFENEEYYENAKAIFDFVWQMLPEVKHKKKKAKNL